MNKAERAILALSRNNRDPHDWARRILDDPANFPKISVEFAREVIPDYKPGAENEIKQHTRKDWAMAAANDLVEF